METTTQHTADLVIAMLADRELELLERIAGLEADVASYRQLAVEGIQALHRVTAERDQLRQRHHALLDEARRWQRAA